jgi:hypothetical protein
LFGLEIGGEGEEVFQFLETPVGKAEKVLFHDQSS